MKLRYLPLLIIFVLLYCPGKYKPSVKKIDAVYLSSLYEDLFRDEPFMAGSRLDTGFVVGHLIPPYPVMTTVLGKLGFFEMLGSTGIDFVISDSALFHAQGYDYYIIPVSSGYAIMNYQGVRFAIFASDQETLDIDTEVQRAIAQQRSDILWMIDRNFLNTPPRHLQFFIENRGLADTSSKAISFVPDPDIIKRLSDFREVVERTLAVKIALQGKTLEDFLLHQVTETANANLLLYPASLFRNSPVADTVTLADMIENIAFEMRFKKTARIAKSDVQDLAQSHEYLIWGTVQDTNTVLLPEPQGEFLFRYYFPIDVSPN